MALVEIQDVRKSYGPLNVLDGVSLSVEKGQVVAIIGRSGSGKSTLLRCVNGLELIQGGEIRVGGDRLGKRPEELRRLRQRVGIVFQSYNLFPHLTVLQNLMLAPRLVKKANKAAAEQWRARCSASSAWPRRPIPSPISSPAASSSAWRSPARSPCSPK